MRLDSRCSWYLACFGAGPAGLIENENGAGGCDLGDLVETKRHRLPVARGQRQRSVRDKPHQTGLTTGGAGHGLQVDANNCEPTVGQLVRPSDRQLARNRTSTGVPRPNQDFLTANPARRQGRAGPPGDRRAALRRRPAGASGPVRGPVRHRKSPAPSARSARSSARRHLLTEGP
jgi:hypothetical protein